MNAQVDEFAAFVLHTCQLGVGGREGFIPSEGSWWAFYRLVTGLQ